MNLSQTLDISARIMSQADRLIQQDARIPDSALHAYWVYSRDLSHQWLSSLAVCQKVLESGTISRSRQCWLEYEPDVREILRADVLHRVWFAILQAADKHHQICHAEPIARSALAAQIQTRMRALKLILAGHQFDAARMKALNQLRRTAEAWSDFLCAHLAFKYGFTDVLYDPQRAETWGAEPLAQMLPELQIPGQSVSLSNLNQTLTRTAPKDFPLNALQKLTAVILDCFPPSTFDKAERN